MGLGTISTYVDRPYRTFQEDVAGDLNNSEFLLVELGSTLPNSVKPNTAAGNEVGVVFEKLQQVNGQPDITVRLLGKGATVKVIQSGAIAYGGKVVVDGAAPTKVKAAPTAGGGTARCLGRKLTPGNGAAGDIIELLDVIETITIPA